MNVPFFQSLRRSYRCTAVACCMAYITQAVAINYAPLLFITFNHEYGIPLSKVTALITISFITQLATDVLSVKIVDAIGRKRCMIFALAISAIGFIGLGIFPELFFDPFTGIVSACILYSCGCGLIEVLTSPVIESCPFQSKQAAMSLLHSFFCWGTVLVIFFSTVFFRLFGTENWQILSCALAIIPFCNIFLFVFVPLPEPALSQKSPAAVNLFKEPMFWTLAVIMMCSGASCHSISQWASAFAEINLGISKTVGDIAGPCLFALLMGSARVLHSKFGGKINLIRYMNICAVFCVVSYFMTSAVRIPFVSVAGCALCGFSCGIFWPGTFSLAAKVFQNKGSTALFALLSLAGDIGCTLGPSIVGFVASTAENNLSLGIISAAIFPLLLTIFLIFINKMGKHDRY